MLWLRHRLKSFSKESISLSEILKSNPAVHVDLVDTVYDFTDTSLAIITNKSFLTDSKGQTLDQVDVFVSSLSTAYLAEDVQFTIHRRKEQNFPLFVTYEPDLRKSAIFEETDKIDLALIPLRSEFVQLSDIRFTDQLKQDKEMSDFIISEILWQLGRHATRLGSILDRRQWWQEVAVGSKLHMFGTVDFAIDSKVHSSTLYYPSSVGSIPTIHISPDDVVIWKPSYNFFSGGPVIAKIGNYAYLAGINYPSKHKDRQLNYEHAAMMHRSSLIYGLIRAYKWHYLLHDPTVRAHVTLGDAVKIHRNQWKKKVHRRKTIKS